jgi:hypothetical protein
MGGKGMPPGPFIMEMPSWLFIKCTGGPMLFKGGCPKAPGGDSTPLGPAGTPGGGRTLGVGLLPWAACDTELLLAPAALPPGCAALDAAAGALMPAAANKELTCEVILLIKVWSSCCFTMFFSSVSNASAFCFIL